ncbi:energy-coupling factor transporter ATPase [Liberiplasma polymorphum]|uniref:energy-coupling factor transporter ATPase n=1 Tax=Liberiplasma polymorphum TaxID=3374570 RepID=UPI003775F2BD
MGIKFERVDFKYHGIDNKGYLALSNVSLNIEKTGEFITLIGETGSGKTTLVQHMNALLTPTAGQVDILGIKINKEVVKKKKVKLNPIRQKVGLVFQFPEYQLFEATVLKDIIFGPKNYGVDEATAIKRAEEVIEIVGLDKSYLSRTPFNLSGGEKKRVSIAGILAMQPDILILDEPTSGLDPVGRDELLKVFFDIHQKLNKTVIIITHDMNTVYSYAKRVLVMRDSYLVYDGNPMSLFTSKNIDSWNLDVPDLLQLTRLIEQKFHVKFPKNPRSQEELVALIEEGLA